MNKIRQSKKELRRLVEKKRQNLSRTWVSKQSSLIISRLLELSEFQSAKTIHCYVAWHNEVDTHSFIKKLLKSARRVVVPTVNLSKHSLSHFEIKQFSELKTGTFGILEPERKHKREIVPGELDLVIVPGVAFDNDGHRIGFGGGYYDRFLAEVSVPKIALAYEFQILEKVPVERQDQKIDILVTEKNVFRIQYNNDANSKLPFVIQKLEETYGIKKWRRKKRNVLDSLIKTVLSQSTSDWNRDMAWDSLKQKYPTWEEVLQLSPNRLSNVIRSAGLANQKAERILDILNWIKNEYGELDINFLCQLPTDEVIEKFTQLKGIGTKTISVVLAFACGKDVFPVDTHVHRLCRRFGFVPQNATPDKTHSMMQKIMPVGKSYSFHINLLKHGRQICKAQNPLCWQCPVFNLCEYEGKLQRKEAHRKG